MSLTTVSSFVFQNCILRKEKIKCIYKFLFLETYPFFTAFVHSDSDFLLLVLISFLIQLFLRTGLALGFLLRGFCLSLGSSSVGSSSVFSFSFGLAGGVLINPLVMLCLSFWLVQWSKRMTSASWVILWCEARCPPRLDMSSCSPRHKKHSTPLIFTLAKCRYVLKRETNRVKEIINIVQRQRLSALTVWKILAICL